MAFRKLIEPDCGQENALTQLGQHFTHDIANTEKIHFAPMDFQNRQSHSADQLVQEFMQETMAVPQTFRMDNLLEEMREIENQQHMMGPIIGPTVKETLHLPPTQLQNNWADEYLSNGSAFNESLASNEQIWANQAQEGSSGGGGGSLLGLGPQWAEQYLSTQTEEQLQEPKSEDISATAGAIVQSLENDPNMQYSKVENKEVRFEDAGSLKKNLEDQWVEEFTNPETEHDPTQFWKTLEDNWKRLSEEDNNWLSFNEESSTQEYKFITKNPMSEIENPLELGKEKLSNFDVPSAVLCFEAACIKTPENAEAWLLLGRAQAQNEQDPLAIQALEQCLRLDPANLQALQALAISQTNENYQSQACNTLIRWLKTHPNYSHLVNFDIDNQTRNVTSFMSESQFKVAEALLIKAVNLDRSVIDEDVQTCLGVLFCLSCEYDKAVDCFNTALQVNPNDPRLWNRVGAALANNSQPEEAVTAYRRALELHPGFIRARYNLGIACINLKAYKEASEHFLEALNQQAKNPNLLESDNILGDKQRVMSDAIWMTLRTCCNLMDRQDLRPLLDNKDLNGLSLYIK